MNLLNDVNGGPVFEKGRGPVKPRLPSSPHTRYFLGPWGISQYEPHPDNLNRQ